MLSNLLKKNNACVLVTIFVCVNDLFCVLVILTQNYLEKLIMFCLTNSKEFSQYLLVLVFCRGGRRWQFCLELVAPFPDVDAAVATVASCSGGVSFRSILR